MLSSTLRVAVLTSRRAPGLDHLLTHPERGRAWDIVGVVTSDAECVERPQVEHARLPFVIRPIEAFCRRRGCRRSDLEARRSYDAATLAHLDAWRANLVLLVGYLHIVTAPLLERFERRLVNLHDADLMIRGPDGIPLYRGLRSTRDAIFDGVRETRTTAHLVTAAVDGGPPLARSWAFPTHPMVPDAVRLGASDILKAYAYAQREWMMRTAWGPLLEFVVQSFEAARVRVLEGRVFVGSEAAPIDLPEPGSRRPGPSRAIVGALR